MAVSLIQSKVSSAGVRAHDCECAIIVRSEGFANQRLQLDLTTASYQHWPSPIHLTSSHPHTLGLCNKLYRPKYIGTTENRFTYIRPMLNIEIEKFGLIFTENVFLLF